MIGMFRYFQNIVSKFYLYFVFLLSLHIIISIHTNNNSSLVTNEQALCISNVSCLLSNVRIASNVVYTTSWSNFTKLSLKHSAEGEPPHLTLRNCSKGEHVKKGLFILKEPYYLGNIGHVLGDDIWAIYSLLYDFHLHNTPTDNVWIIVPIRFQNEFWKTPIIRELYGVLTSNSVLFVDETKESEVIYERMIMGWSGYGYVAQTGHFINLNLLMSFRQRFLRHVGLNDKQRGKICNVLFIEKNMTASEHKYSINNTKELMDHLRKKTKCSIEAASWYGMPLREQILKIYSKDIVVGLPGSDIMNCIFQPIKSAMIVPDKCDETGYCSGSNEIGLWFGRIQSRKVKTIAPRDDGIVWKANIGTWNKESFLTTVLDILRLLYAT